MSVPMSVPENKCGLIQVSDGRWDNLMQFFGCDAMYSGWQLFLNIFFSFLDVTIS